MAKDKNGQGEACQKPDQEEYGKKLRREFLSDKLTWCLVKKLPHTGKGLSRSLTGKILSYYRPVMWFSLTFRIRIYCIYVLPCIAIK